LLRQQPGELLGWMSLGNSFHTTNLKITQKNI
jgi:hypothetical protein